MKVHHRINSVKHYFVRSTSFGNLAWLSLIIIGFGTLISSYINIKYSETISFSVQDGWCDPKLQGIGTHCFGDFYAPITSAGDTNPWIATGLKFAYPPVSFAYFHLMGSQYLIAIFIKFPLYLNIFLTLIALSIPGLHQIWTKRQPLKEGKWVIAIMLTATPALMLIDRGTNNYLLVPLLYFYFNAIRSEKSTQSLGLLVLMVLWKPQMFIFVLLYLTSFGFRKTIKATLITIGAILGSFVLYPHGVLQNISDWISNSRAYQTYSPIPTPGNYSFANLIGFLRGALRFLHSDGVLLGSAFRPPMSQLSVTAVSLVFGILTLGALYAAKRNLNLNYQILATTVFFLLIPGTTFGYYLVFLLVPLIFMIEDCELQTKLPSRQSWSYAVYGILLFVMVPAWPINLRNLGIPVPPVWEYIGVHWMFTHLLLVALAVVIFIDFLSIIIESRRVYWRISFLKRPRFLTRWG